MRFLGQRSRILWEKEAGRISLFPLCPKGGRPKRLPPIIIGCITAEEHEASEFCCFYSKWEQTCSLRKEIT
jgi:hypothetical protein